jgi:uncharacterized membrane protein
MSDPDPPERPAVGQTPEEWVQQTWSDGVRSGAELAGRAATIPNRAWMSVGEPESRWPAGIAILVAIVLQFVLSLEYTIRPRWAIPALEIALLVVLLIANPKRIDTFSRSVRMGSLTLLGVLMLTNGWSALKLIRALLTGAGGKGTILLGTGAAIWATNTIAFGIWYWEFDRGGPGRRSQGTKTVPDFLFPQMDLPPDLAPPHWAPTFVDYLYLSFTNATAFSPTDVLPLTRWAKFTMMMQSALSLVVVGLVVARAVNILK